MSAQPAKEFKRYTPEQRASFLASRFGSQLDWSSRILVEIKYPVEELRWFVDAVMGICKGKDRRIAHATIATRAQRYGNPAQAKSLVKRAIETDRAWSRGARCLVFDIETPKPGEREGREKRARTRYTDYLTPVAVWAQEAEQRARRADEMRWKKDSKYRFAARAEILADAVAMLPSFERAEDMPATAQAKEKQPLSFSEYVEQREKILLAEKTRILDRLSEGDLIDAEEISERIEILETSRRRVLREIEKDYASTLEVLRGLKSNRLQRAMDFTDVEEVRAEVDAMLGTKGVAGDPLSEPAEWLREATEPADAPAPLSTSCLSGNECTKGVAGVPLSKPLPGEVEVVIGDEPAPLAGAAAAPSMLECALSYAALGYPVFPLKLDKTPLTAHGFYDAATDEATIRDWWRRRPTAGIGVATGAAAGWFVLDVDSQHGGDASLSALIEHHGDLPTTLCARSGGGGSHYFFAYPVGSGLTISEGKLGKGLDTRGEGGYIVVAPTVHPSGNAYEWRNALEPAPLPQWIIDALKSEKHAPVDTDRKVLPVIGGGKFYGEGERNKGLRNLACGWWRHGHVADEQELYQRLLDARTTRCAAGKDSPATDAQLWGLTQRTARKYLRADLAQEVARV